MLRKFLPSDTNFWWDGCIPPTVKGIQSSGAYHHLVVLCILPPEAGTTGCRKAVAQGLVGGVRVTCLSPYIS